MEPALSHCLAPNDWVATAREAARTDSRAVLVFVVRHYGSTPRDKGSWMVIQSDQSQGTLGGGEVERVVEAAARDMLAGRRSWTRVYEKFLLGPDMGQCCGGGMEVVFEPVDQTSVNWLDQAQSCIKQNQAGFVRLSWLQPEKAPSVNSAPVAENINAADGVHIQPLVDERPSVVIYGAGHVARAIAGIAAHLPIRLTLVDDRSIELQQVPVAANVCAVFMEDPLSHVISLDETTSAVLVMTYSHALDYRLCLALLKNQDLRYVGLIGSKSKGARFRRRFMQDDGLTRAEIARLISPIGASASHGKEPGLIALAALNEIMFVVNSDVSENPLQINEIN